MGFTATKSSLKTALSGIDDNSAEDWLASMGDHRFRGYPNGFMASPRVPIYASPRGELTGCFGGGVDALIPGYYMYALQINTRAFVGLHTNIRAG